MSESFQSKINKRRISRRFTTGLASKTLQTYFPSKLNKLSLQPVLTDITNIVKADRRPTVNFKKHSNPIADLIKPLFFKTTLLVSNPTTQPIPFAPYVDSIFSHLKESATINQPSVDFMLKQPELSSSIRSILVDWMVEVSCKFRLNDDTLFLAVNMLDRFLSSKIVKVTEFQLVGAACLLTASKNEEIYPRKAKDFVNMAQGAFIEDDLIKKEKELLIALDFEVLTVTAWNLLGMFSLLFSLSGEEKRTANYYLHICLMDSQLVAIKPNLIAAAALHISLTKSTVTSELYDTLDVQEEETRNIARDLLVKQAKLAESKLRAVSKKFMK